MSCVGMIHNLVQIMASAMDPDSDSLKERNSHHGSSLNIYTELYDDYSMDIDADHHSENLDQGGGGFTVGEEVVEGAAIGYGEGMMFMGLFNSDQFAEERKTNLFYPFTRKEDWQIGHYLLSSGLSMSAIDKFLSLDWIKTLPLSFWTAKELCGHAELLPKGPQWKCQQIETSHLTKSPVWLYWCDSIELLEALFSHPLFCGKIDLVPQKVYQMATRLV
ncbi:hypothetical protein PAXINDRAFT_15697 [Paxillus involutus ATCC 200175]|uniref:Uncharacterized protein n=1 Tax=Paxillus involutus ATCC 200175 TaxID=664439 RepID=A0A0C9TL37_PAXIN|nr:hypothetical protein PAXINDRAFT_15697 [Paxillus involutus ATCC 200175]